MKKIFLVYLLTFVVFTMNSQEFSMQKSSAVGPLSGFNFNSSNNSDDIDIVFYYFEKIDANFLFEYNSETGEVLKISDLSNTTSQKSLDGLRDQMNANFDPSLPNCGCGSIDIICKAYCALCDWINCREE